MNDLDLMILIEEILIIDKLILDIECYKNNIMMEVLKNETYRF